MSLLLPIHRLLKQAHVKAVSLALFTGLALIACQQPTDTNTDAANTADTETTDTESTDINIETSAPTDNTTAVQAESTSTQSINDNNTNSQATVQIIEQPITILALGDSLTEGLGLAQDDAYPAQLQDALHDMGYVNATVVNSGLSGETSSGLVNRLDWALKTDPDITILTIGANDAMRGIDVATVEQNLSTAIERLQSEGSIVVLGGMSIYDNLGDDYVTAFSDIYPKLAEEYDVAFIPFFLEGVGGVTELNQADAIHPTAEGYAHIINDNILPVLKPTLDDLLADNEALAEDEALADIDAETAQ